MTTMPERTATLTGLIAQRIRSRMGWLNIRQRELAKRLGENDQWVSVRINGKVTLDVNELHRFAKALEVGISELLPSDEEAARAVTIGPAIPRYLDVAVRPDRPADNRPSGKPGTGIGRTARLPRGRRPAA
jgi:transcriptional regulator with XRE-family HTH domain